MIWLEAILIGLAVGVVVGALGAGGGVLSVPILVYLLHQEPHAAAASSLVIVALTAMTSLLHHHRSGNVAWRSGAVFALITVAGAFTGSRLSALVPATTLMLLFSGMLAVVAAAMLAQGLKSFWAESSAPTEDAATDSVAGVRWGAVIGAALFTGFLTGFFGVGGGFIVVPILVLALRLPMRMASGTSLLVMIVASISSLVSRLGTPVVIDWQVTLLFAAGSMAGGLAGGPLSARLRPSTLTLLFAALLAGVAVASGAATLLAH